MREIELPSNLTEEEERSLQYLNYPTRPIVIPAIEAVASGDIQKVGENMIVRFNRNEDGSDVREELTIASDHQYDLVASTVSGFDDALARADGGAYIKDAFEVEKQKIGDPNEPRMDYGNWVYYPRSGKLFHFPEEYWYRLGIYLSNSRLMMDPERRMSFDGVRQKLEGIVPVFIGLSVNNNAAQAAMKDSRFKTLIASDPAWYKMTNLNRVIALRPGDMVLSEAEKREIPHINGLRQKWQVFAEQAHEVDPFMKIFCYPEANEENLDAMVAGNRIQPRADFVVEICDTLTIKLAAAEVARKNRAVLIRASDVGSSVFVDVMRYDLNPNLPLTLGISDDELTRLARLSNGGPQAFFRFADALIGSHTNRDDEFGALIRREIPPVSSSIPQLGSTAMIAGGIVSKVIAEVALGHQVPQRKVYEFP